MSGGASPSGGAAYLDPASPQSQPGVPHSVLRVIIENMLYPITIDVLHQVIYTVYMYFYYEKVCNYTACITYYYYYTCVVIISDIFQVWKHFTHRDICEEL